MLQKSLRLLACFFLLTLFIGAQNPCKASQVFAYAQVKPSSTTPSFQVLAMCDNSIGAWYTQYMYFMIPGVNYVGMVTSATVTPATNSSVISGLCVDFNNYWVYHSFTLVLDGTNNRVGLSIDNSPLTLAGTDWSMIYNY